MTKILLSFFLILSFVCAPLGHAHANTEEGNIDTTVRSLEALRAYLVRTYSAQPALTSAELRTSIMAGAAWLIEAAEDDGHFKYEYVPYTGTYRKDDNVVRQAGALYALGEIIRRTEGDTYDVGPVMKKSISYLESLSREDTLDHKTFRCVAKSEASKRCTLGATALALIGTLSYVESNPHEAKKYSSLIRDYRTYILSMQKESGGFRDTYTVGSTVQSDTESSFSNGEALLALVRSYTYTSESGVRTAIDSAFAYLAKQPFDANLYLWIMAAVKDMETLWPSDIYTAYAKAFTLWRITEAKHFTNPTRNYCAYTEGLASALSFLNTTLTTEEYVHARAELDKRNANHHSLQITEQDTVRLIIEKGVPRLGTLTTPHVALGGFLTGDAEPTERIDFTQHCLGAYIQTLVDIEHTPL